MRACVCSEDLISRQNNRVCLCVRLGNGDSASRGGHTPVVAGTGQGRRRRNQLQVRLPNRVTDTRVGFVISFPKISQDSLTASLAALSCVQTRGSNCLCNKADNFSQTWGYKEEPVTIISCIFSSGYDTYRFLVMSKNDQSISAVCLCSLAALSVHYYHRLPVSLSVALCSVCSELVIGHTDFQDKEKKMQTVLTALRPMTS